MYLRIGVHVLKYRLRIGLHVLEDMLTCTLG